MQLTLSKSIPSPLSTHLRFVHVLESKGAFLLADHSKVVLLRFDGSMELIANLDDREYQWEGIGAEFALEVAQKRVNGFKMLSHKEKELFEQSDAYKSARDIPVATYAHDGALLVFSGKNVALLEWQADQLMELKRIKTKGRDPIARALHPEENLLVYGTNYGELYSQAFSEERFLKSTKVDQLPNTCYQITFTPDGRRMFVAGLGFVKSYGYDDHVFTPGASITTAVRSFELVEDYLVLNKGMHGLDVLRITDKPERVAALDPPFMTDKMYYLAPQKTFLLISGSTNEWALLRWTA
ncbi:hypothetical protein [Dyadobacter fermentans]|uniref:Uncharacterized protein n=1 Tax=Dyadobacter fermentans (strain ATCC 700827 / DSM 18053 / CIP 107007 / KCTC 52180 / NS114) TaxID=471854 RepID=C6VY97_DYAFD|nr:hypothetical protein [Dyadobacter fermentans]ACT91576.1 hypothetical protein Dfer_0306 [Dyadobacter fermentans DSM 18053]